jgi:hypothetical protein
MNTKYCQVLDNVICIDEITKIVIKYNNGTNYRNQWIHSLFITYKNGKFEEIKTTDYDTAKSQYENLKCTLLGQ